MRIGKGPRLLLAATLGAATVVLPAVAGSETIPSITAYNAPGVYGGHYWEPASVKVAPGGTVQISNNTNVPHGVHWLSGPATPECTPGVPVGSTETQSGTQWSGSCTLAAAGTYTFDCTVHGAAMSGSITVTAGGGTTTTTTTQTSPPPGTPTTPTITTPAPTLLVGSAASALHLGPANHGSRIAGTIDLAPQGAGSRLEASVFVARDALGRRRGPARVRVAHTVLVSLPQGTSRFTLVLDTAARRALHSRSRLRLTIQLRLTPSTGAPLSLTRALTVRR